MHTVLYFFSNFIHKTATYPPVCCFTKDNLEGTFFRLELVFGRLSRPSGNSLDLCCYYQAYLSTLNCHKHLWRPFLCGGVEWVDGIE